MEESVSRYCKVCVTGGAGFIGSSLIKKLLDKGVYYVHATLRNLGDSSKVNLLKSIPGAETRLKLFEADIYNPQQFEAAIKDCKFVFHVATPIHPDKTQDKEISEAAVAGVRSIAFSCIRSGTVKRLIYTATVMAAAPLKNDSTGYMDFMDENFWTPLNHPLVTSSPHKDYKISKTGSEKEALRFGEGGNLEVVTLALGLVGGDSLLSFMPVTTAHMISQILQNEFIYQMFRLLEELLGKIPILHIEDTCEAHIFCMEKDSLQGRFLCASDYVSCAEISNCLQQICPEFPAKQVHMDVPERNTRWASTKLQDQGFKYNYDMKMLLDDCVKCAKKFGEL